MQISVVIPTRKRPEMLRVALESIQSQSRLDFVAEVIVSENSDNTASQEVAKEFPELPIKYIIQTEVVDAYNHFPRAVDHAACEWVAMIGDDDMWGCYHLEEAAKGLAKHPDSVAFVSQCVVVSNELRGVRAGYTRWLRAYRAEKPQVFRKFWIWNAEELLVESLTRTPLNIWGLVARRKSLRTAMEFLREGKHGFDADRYMWWRLGNQGSIVIGPEVGLFYRIHENSSCGEMENANSGFHQETSGGYTKAMINEAERAGIDWKAAWLEVWRSLSSSEREEAWKLSIPGAREALRDSLGLGESELFPQSCIRSKSLLVMKQCIPPIAIALLKRILKH